MEKLMSVKFEALQMYLPDQLLEFEFSAHIFVSV